MKDLQEEVTAILNVATADNDSNTPDFILAAFLMDCLRAFNRAVNERSEWYGRHDEPGQK